MNFNQVLNVLLAEEAKKAKSIFDYNEVVNKVMDMDLDSAKQKIKKIMDAHPKMDMSSKRIVFNIINTSNTNKQLAQRMSDFILASKGEKLGSIDKEITKGKEKKEKK